MAGAGPMTSSELAAKTKTSERYVREWLNANAASGYIIYDAAAKTFELPPEQAIALTAIDLPETFHIVSACFKGEPKITQAFRTGVKEAGFIRFRRAAQTPFNLVYEARP